LGVSTALDTRGIEGFCNPLDTQLKSRIYGVY